MRVVKKNNHQKVAGSRNMTIPTITAPTAPIPVHTGYAVPNGIVCVALASKIAKLAVFLYFMLGYCNTNVLHGAFLTIQGTIRNEMGTYPMASI